MNLLANRFTIRVLLILPFFLASLEARPQDAVTTRAKFVQNSSQNVTTRVENEERTVPRTTRSPTLRDSVKMVASQLINSTAADFTLDTRTPPKIRLQHKILEKKKQEAAENSHPGVAVPVDIDSFIMETSTQKRSIFYRNEYKQPTTDSGISTWILLSGQSTTPKPNRKQTTAKTTLQANETKTVTTTEKSVKSTIKLKPITTQKTKTTTTVAPATTATTTTKLDKAQNNKILTKIKASILSSAANGKNKTANTIPAESTTQSTTITTKKNNQDNNKATTQVANTESNELPLEAKIVDMDLPEEKMVTTTKRPRRPTQPNKRKKNNNKNRRRKPTVTANEKNSNATNTTKIAQKHKPFGTQIYNYLSREVMPTVGVGLVGLVLTAGLASYFLYPFGGLRRAYDAATDRKDYFYDDYSPGGVAEEEIIGKVIAGMPENSEYANSYRSSLARKEAYRTDLSYKQRNSDYFQYPKDYKTVSVGSPVSYRHDVISEQQKESGYTVGDRGYEKKHFVVGNVPKELEQPVTPVTVPEHGPRSLRTRRQAKELDEENEVIDYKDKPQGNYENNYEKVPLTDLDKQTTYSETSEEPEFATPPPEPTQPNFFTFLRNLLELKFRLGLNFLLRTTDNFANYLRGVQERVDHILREQKSAPKH